MRGYDGPGMWDLGTVPSPAQIIPRDSSEARTGDGGSGRGGSRGIRILVALRVFEALVAFERTVVLLEISLVWG